MHTGTRTWGLCGTLAGLALLAGCATGETPASPPVSPSVSPSVSVPASPSAAGPSTAAAAVSDPLPADASGVQDGQQGRPDAVSGDPRCAPAQLEGRIEPEGAATGHRYATLVVTNSSTHTCTLYGYGGAALYTASGVPIPTQMVRVGDPGPALVRLLPGQQAGMDLHWTVVATGDEPVEGPCEVPASEIRVIPPDETSPFWVIWDQGPVCDGGRIEQSAYHPLPAG